MDGWCIILSSRETPHQHNDRWCPLTSYVHCTIQLLLLISCFRINKISVHVPCIFYILELDYESKKTKQVLGIQASSMFSNTEIKTISLLILTHSSFSILGFCFLYFAGTNGWIRNWFIFTLQTLKLIYSLSSNSFRCFEGVWNLAESVFCEII